MHICFSCWNGLWSNTEFTSNWIVWLSLLLKQSYLADWKSG